MAFITLDGAFLTLSGVYIVLGSDIPAAETTRQPGGWLPIVYVDREGRPVDLKKSVQNAVEAAPASERAEIAEAAQEAIQALQEQDIEAILSEAFARSAAIMLENLQRVDAALAQIMAERIEAARIAAEDDLAILLLVSF